MREQQAVSRFIVPPFAIDSETGEPVSESLELVTVYRLAEKRRARGLLKRSEEIEFLSLAYYPLWIAPIQDSTAIIDPLKLVETSIGAGNAPPVDEFVEVLQAAHNDRRSFSDILTAYHGSFDRGPSQKPRRVKGLVSGELGLAFAKYLALAKRLDSAPPSGIIVSGEQCEKVLKSVIPELQEMIDSLHSLSDRLGVALSVLDRETQHNIAHLKAEIEGIENEYREQAGAVRGALSQAVDDLRRRKSSEINIVESRFSEAKELLHSHLSDYQKILRSMEKQRDVFSRIVQAQSEQVEKGIAQAWRELLEYLPKRIKQVGEEVEKIQALIRAMDEERGRQADRIERSYDELIQVKIKMLDDIDAEREIDVKKRRVEIEDIAEKSASLRSEIQATLERVRAEAKNPSFLLPRAPGKDEITISYVPFYLVAYSGGAKSKGFYAISPSIFNSAHGALTMGLGVLENRLKPFSEAMKYLFGVTLVEKLKQDFLLRDDLHRRLKPCDVLRSTRTSDKILEGLDTAYNKGWLHYTTVFSLRRAIKKLLSEG